VDVRSWMPFSADGVNYAVTISVAVPYDSGAETAAIQAALLDPITQIPSIRFDMPGGNPNRWYDIGTIEVE
jgi:hypothetical protein